ncbi:MAG: DUF167 domain-containing protein [Thermosphaera sp.]
MNPILQQVVNILQRNMVESSKGIILQVRVEPRSSSEGFTIESDELVFKTGEPAERGRANAALIKYLSRELRIPVSKIDIIYGQRERLKKVLIMDETPDKIIEKLVRVISLI